jgi:hypothetical protein
MVSAQGFLKPRDLMAMPGRAQAPAAASLRIPSRSLLDALSEG